MEGKVVFDPDDRFTQDDVNAYLKDIAEMLAEASKQGSEALNQVERYLCQNDIYYLGLFILGIQKMYSENVNGTEVFHPWIFNRCREVQADPNFHVDIWAREHFKSTIITLLKTVQDILNNPEIAICIYSYNSTIAKKFVRQIREALEINRLKELFPDIIPEDTKVGKYKAKDEYGREQVKKFTWSDENFTVKRKTGRKEPTVSGYGLVTGQPTGMHFDILVYDDVVTPDSVKTQTQNEYTTAQWQMSLNTGSGESVLVRVIGTRYAERDTYFHILNPMYKEKNVLGNSKYTLRKKPCMKPDGTTVLYTKEYISNKKNTMHGFVFASQMMCDPQESNAFKFSEEWLRRRCDQQNVWENRENYNWMIIVDPANSKGKHSDFTSMVVVGAGSDRNYYIADGVRDKLNLTERVDKIFGLVERWEVNGRPPIVVWEQSGLLSDMEILRKEMSDRNYFFSLKAATTKPRLFADQRMSGVPLKEARIQATEPLFSKDRIILATEVIQYNYLGQRENIMQSFIDNEYLPYPFVDHDDFFDALSRIADAETGPLLVFPRSKKEERSKLLLEAKRRAVDAWAVDADGYIPF